MTDNAKQNFENSAVIYDDTEFHKPLFEGLEAWNLTLPILAVNRLCAYLALMQKTNEVMNLTAVTEPVEMVKRHLLDSLSLMKLQLVQSGALLDIGSGAGLPGIPLAISDTTLKVTLLDSTQKRVRFLETVKKALCTDNVTCLWGRAESLAAPPLRESFDFVTARAVSGMDVLAEYALPFLRVGGVFLPLKAENLDAELDNAKKAIHLLGGEIEAVLHYTVPGTEALRRIPVIRKVKSTPQRFPRKTNFIGKKEIL